MKRRIIAIAIIIAAIFTPVGFAGGAPGSIIKKLELVGIKNFSRMEESSGFAGTHAGFGGATQPSAMALLSSEGFVAVINLRVADEEGANIEGSRTAAIAAGLNYIHLPFDVESPAPDIVDRFLAAASDQTNQPIFIHCNSATRAAALWMIGRVLEDGWDIETAGKEAEITAAKPDDAIAFATAYLASREK